MVNVFISHPTPYTKQQESFLILLKDFLLKLNLNPVNLGSNNWSYQKPLRPIKDLIHSSKGAILVGLVRHHSYIGYEKEGTPDQTELIHKYSTSPWIHIEGGMAYQAGLPILTLKESQVYAEGILDPNNTESYIYNFNLREDLTTLPEEIKQIIESWADTVLRIES